MLISKNFLTREASYKPSYFTSWSQFGRSGTLVALVGKQNSKELSTARDRHWTAKVRIRGRSFRAT